MQHRLIIPWVKQWFALLQCRGQQFDALYEEEKTAVLLNTKGSDNFPKTFPLTKPLETPRRHPRKSVRWPQGMSTRRTLSGIRFCGLCTCVTPVRGAGSVTGPENQVRVAPAVQFSAKTSRDESGK